MSTVTNLTPNFGAIGDSVTIAGTGFGAVQGGSTVTFNGTAVSSYTSWSDTSLVVVVPAATTSGRVVVTVGGAAQTDYKTSWFEIRDTSIRGIEDLKAQDETSDTSPEDWRYADARDLNHLAHLVYNSLARVNEFRLTLTTATAVTTADVTGATTIYLTPYVGNRIALYNGRSWDVLTSAEVSLALGTLTSGKNYDVFAYNNSGTLTLELLVWTNDTTRGTSIGMQDGVWVKSGAFTRRLVGTIRTTSTTETADAAATRFVANACNLVPKTMACATETTDTWAYTTATWRSANNSATNRLQYVQALNERMVEAYARGFVMNSSAINACVGVGVDATNANSAQLFGHETRADTTVQSTEALYRGWPGVGFHYLQWLEISDAAGTTNWYGDNGVAAQFQAGIIGMVWV